MRRRRDRKAASPTLTTARSSALVAAVLAVGFLLVPGPPPAAGSDGPCPGTTGVTVVVDYQALGGGVIVHCAAGSPATGFKALIAAGFDMEEVRNVPGFLCRIDGRPGPDRDPCINTPPASAYWSYWHAARGGAWISSQEGGKTRTPPGGSVDGWSFSDDGSPGDASPPRIDPPATTATPKPATITPATPKPATPTPAATARPAATRAASAAPAAPSSASATASNAVASSAPTTASATVSSADSTPLAGSVAHPGASAGPGGASAVGSAVPVGTSADGDGPPLGTLVGAGLVVLIAAGALVAGARRSRSGNGDA